MEQVVAHASGHHDDPGRPDRRQLPSASWRVVGTHMTAGRGRRRIASLPP